MKEASRHSQVMFGVCLSPCLCSDQYVYFFFAIACGVILGARFDINGFCVNHPKLRMCKLTSDGKYIIVRKTCQRCGSAGLNDR